MQSGQHWQCPFLSLPKRLLAFPKHAPGNIMASINHHLILPVGAALVNGPKTPLKLPSCPSGHGGREPQRQAQPAAAAAAATMKDVSGSEEKADNDCNDDDKSCSAEEDNKVAKRNRAHQKDYTQRKRVRACELLLIP